MANHGLSQQLTARKVLELSSTALVHLWDVERAQYVIPISFHEGTLKLESTSGAALQQLRIEETRFLNELNRQLGERVVRHLNIQAKGF